MQYKHLTIKDREIIQEMLWEQKSVRAIARGIKRSPSSISRKVNKNRSVTGKRYYTPRVAHEKAVKNRSKRGREKRLKNKQVRDFVIKYLKTGWSPEQIANTINREIGETISYEAIYQYIYAQIHRCGYGLPKQGCEDLRPYLARRRKWRNKKGGRRSFRINKGPLPSIEDRPEEVDLRTDVGHWENDLVESSQSKSKLKTINERYSGLVFIQKVQNGTIVESNSAMINKLGKIPKQYLKTLNNG